MTDFLAVDTSSRYLTVIAHRSGKTVKRFIPDCALNHSVILMDEIDRAMGEAGLTPADCSFFGAVTGPGSFTGIRIGLSTVKGFALATGKKLLGVTSFDMLAYNVNEKRAFAVCIDALHNHYYCCGYAPDRSVIVDPCYLSAQEVEALGMPVYGFEDLPLADYTRMNADECLAPAICALQDRLDDDIRALYVRKSQAEEARKC